MGEGDRFLEGEERRGEEGSGSGGVYKYTGPKADGKTPIGPWSSRG